MITIRKAKIRDAKEIQELIEPYAKEGIMLSRPIYEIYENIRDYFIAEANSKIVGCCSLHIFGREYKPKTKIKEAVLAELRALAVAQDWQKKKIGRGIVRKCFQEGKWFGITKIFALTLQENIEFFEKLGFKKINKINLPQKIWLECVRCLRFPSRCNEIALIRKL